MTPQALPTQLLPSIRNDNRGVSPVIGVILMVAITVILAAVIGVFVLGQDTPEVVPNAQSSIETPAAGDATITLDRTDSTDKDIHVIANGATYGTVSNSGDSVGVYDLSEGDKIQLVYYGEENSHIIQTFEYKYEPTSGSSTVSFTCDKSAGQLVVNPSGGSEDCEYTTIQAAVDGASAGDTIQVYDATYDENTLVVDKELTITGESESGVTIQASNPTTCSASGNECNVDITGNSVTLNKLTIDSTGVPRGVEGTGTAMTLDTVTLSNAGSSNAAVTGTVTQSTITDADLSMSPASTASDNTVSNANLFLAPDATGTDNTIQTGGIFASGGSTVSNNDISNSSTDGIYIIDNGASGAVIEDNTITGSTWHNINLNRDDSTIRNNVITEADRKGIHVKANNTLIEYNTITDNNAGGYGAAGIETHFDSVATGQTIRNNELVNNGVGIRFHAKDSNGDPNVADSHTVTDNIIYSSTEGVAIEEVDSSGEPDVANLQGNYWGHNDGGNTNSDCTPASSRILNDVDVSNPLCTAPTAGAS